MRQVVIAILIASIVFIPAVARADSPTHVVAYGETLYSIARQYGITPQALADANGITAQSWVYAGQRLIIPGSALAASVSVASAQTSPGGMYTVRAGDTLYSVSRQFGVSVDEIAQANDIPPNGFLYTGWQLKIPGAAAAKKSAPAPAQNENASAENESASAQNENASAQNENASAQNENVSSQNNAPAQNENASAQNENASAQNASANSANNTAMLRATSYIVQPGDTLFRIAVKHGVTIQAIIIANNLPTQFIYSGQRLMIPGVLNDAAPIANTVNSYANNAAFASGINVQVAAVPLHKQKQTLTCEEAAVAMASLGALNEDDIVANMERSENPFEGIRGETDYDLFGGLTHYGTYAQALKKGLEKMGRAATVYYGQPYENFRESVLQNLREGRPVVWWTTWRESHQTPQWVILSNGTKIPLTPYEHTVVIVAANDKGITYHDPYDGTVRSASWADHQRTSGYFNNMALVVY